MKIIGYRTVKTGVGVSLAMIVATAAGLQYAAAAGIITMLSIQSTKRESVKIAFQRIGSCILAMIIASIIFNIAGYNPVAFGVFLLIFIPLTVKFNLEQGIIVSSVIATHLLGAKNTGIPLIANELALMFIGVIIALFLNLYIPSIENVIKEDQEYIEDRMKDILLKMAIALKKQEITFSEEELFQALAYRIKAAKKRAYQNLNNYIISDMSYYVEYMEMRRQQFKVLKKIKDKFQRFSITYEHSIMVADFTEKISKSFYEENTGEVLLKELEALRGEFKKMALPVTRDEFENRAMLYQFLNELEELLLIKFEFMKNVSLKG